MERKRDLAPVIVGRWVGEIARLKDSRKQWTRAGFFPVRNPRSAAKRCVVALLRYIPLSRTQRAVA